MFLNTWEIFFSSLKLWHAPYKRESIPFVKSLLNIKWNSPWSLRVHFKSLKSSLLLSWFLSWEDFSSDQSFKAYPLGFITKVTSSPPFIFLKCRIKLAMESHAFFILPCFSLDLNSLHLLEFTKILSYPKVHTLCFWK